MNDGEQLTIAIPGIEDELHAKPDRKLGARQAFAIRRIRERGGIEADELGALLHADRGKHADHVRCQWCAQEGNAVLASLRTRGLVVHRRTGRWEFRNENDYQRPSAQGELPDGF